MQCDSSPRLRSILFTLGMAINKPWSQVSTLLPRVLASFLPRGIYPLIISCHQSGGKRTSLPQRWPPDSCEAGSNVLVFATNDYFSRAWARDGDALGDVIVLGRSALWGPTVTMFKKLRKKAANPSFASPERLRSASVTRPQAQEAQARGQVRWRTFDPHPP